MGGPRRADARRRLAESRVGAAARGAAPARCGRVAHHPAAGGGVGGGVAFGIGGRPGLRAARRTRGGNAGAGAGAPRGGARHRRPRVGRRARGDR